MCWFLRFMVYIFEGIGGIWDYYRNIGFKEVILYYRNIKKYYKFFMNVGFCIRDYFKRVIQINWCKVVVYVLYYSIDSILYDFEENVKYI